MLTTPLALLDLWYWRFITSASATVAIDLDSTCGRRAGDLIAISWRRRSQAAAGTPVAEWISNPSCQKALASTRHRAETPYCDAHAVLASSVSGAAFRAFNASTGEDSLDCRDTTIRSASRRVR